MATKKEFNWAGVFAYIVVAIAVGCAIGWKFNELSEKAASLERERLAFQTPVHSGQGFHLSEYYSPVEDARRARLDSKIFYARQEADDWAARLLVYIGAAILLAGVIFIVTPLIGSYEPRRREDFVELTELGRKTKDRLNAAGSSIGRIMPRQPTVGGLSTADELRKWEELRKEGLVTDEEFKKTRDKLVG
ncbi:MAG: hypothetical protein EON87_15940 [Brevundimonas sp.]|nr:MAG: hypothetical protein EON87_15940 [Brevundimonas sp.]